MAAVIVLSNFTVQYPINDWLTWGAFTYPLVFLVCDLTNRAIGPAAARRVAWAGFAVAVLVSGLVAPWRIALASGTAFIVSQLLDVLVFNRWRRASWWKAPLIGSQVASVVDTGVFFFLAFAGTVAELAAAGRRRPAGEGGDGRAAAGALPRAAAAPADLVAGTVALSAANHSP
jgi:uncharacterized PurR-regulated membrane protein YhhQ (DUF165 family)